MSSMLFNFQHQLKNIRAIRFFKYLRDLLFISIIVIFFTASIENNNKPFSLIILPDTQDYTSKHSKILISQIEWIKQNIKGLNIVYVIHLGDITSGNSAKEWIVARDAFTSLDGTVPYALALGNHDLDYQYPRDPEKFNSYFPVSKYSKLPGWGGTYEDNHLENSYQFFNAGGKKYMILTLEFGPREEVIDWAYKLVKKYPDHHIIINTHCYMYDDNTRVSKQDRWNPHNFSWLKPSRHVNDGEEIWYKLIYYNKNIFFVTSGHIKGIGAGKLISKGHHGNNVCQILANYQYGVTGSMNGKSGFLRIITFYPSENIIAVKAYSPYLKKWNHSFDHEFDIDLTNGTFKEAEMKISIQP